MVLVSSGAIATGMPYLRLDERPSDLATQQAAAAVGQNVLIYRYQEALRPFRIVAGQVLLTAGDLENPTPRSNARRAMERLLGLRILPIVNENDTVATHEIRFGDNDRLAALVASLIGADALVLLSDIESLYTRPPDEPGARPIHHIEYGDDLRGYEFGSVVVNSVGTGGAATKVSAARRSRGIRYRRSGHQRRSRRSRPRGDDIGTWFDPHPEPVSMPLTGPLRRATAPYPVDTLGG